MNDIKALKRAFDKGMACSPTTSNAATATTALTLVNGGDDMLSICHDSG
jgi:hypothetical protein